MKNKNVVKILVLIFLFLSIGCKNVFASEVINEERIINFESEININEDSSADVIEVFTINVTENLKNEYVFKRVIPIEYGGRTLKVVVDEVLDNEKKVEYTSVPRNRDFIIKVNKNLETGYHTFLIKYRVYNLIDFSKDYDEVRWHLFGDTFLFPINKYNVKVSFPNKTKIVEDKVTVYTYVNDLEYENVNVSKKIEKENVEFSSNSLIYPGEDIILNMCVNKGTIEKVPFNEKIWDFFTENVISIIIVLLSGILLVWKIFNIKKIKSNSEIIEQKDKNIYSKNTIKILILFTWILLEFIVAILIGMNVNYYNTIKYVNNVFTKFFFIAIVEGFISITLYFVARYEIYKRGILSKVLGIFVALPVLFMGIIFLMNFSEDIFYNWFGYLVLMLTYIQCFYFIYNIKKHGKVLIKMELEDENLEKE